MTEQLVPQRVRGTLRYLFRSPKIQTLLAVVPIPGAQQRADGQDKHDWQWLRSIPLDTAPGLAVCFFESGPTSTGNLTWQAVLDGGRDFLACLSELIENEKLQHCPILLASHGVGGLVVKEVSTFITPAQTWKLTPNEALRRAYQQQFNFRHFLEALAGVVLFGTPHSTSEDIESWQSTTLLLQAGLISKKKRSVDVEAIERFAKFSLEFEQANVLAPILSVFETQPSKIKVSVVSAKKVLLTGENFVATHSRHEELLGLDCDHKNLCNINITSTGFAMIIGFLTTVLEDTRLRIVRGSPQYKAASALDEWTVCDPDDNPVSINEGQNKSVSELNSAGRSDPFTRDATVGSSEDGFEMVRQVNDIPSGRRRSQLPCHIIPVARNKGFFGRADVLLHIARTFFETHEDVETDEEANQVKTFAVCGPGGMGKTQIATEFMFSHKDRFDAIFWIYADRAGKIAEGFTRIALELGLVTADSVDSHDPVVTRDLVKGWLANPMKAVDPADEDMTDQASWLIIFDNADNPEELEDFWPLDGPGCVLFTSRDPLAKHSNYLALNGIDLKPFTVDEGSKFLSKLTMNEEDSSDVVRILGGLPLAMTQMAGVIVRRDLTFEEFAKTYNEEESRGELLQLRLDQRRRRSGYEHTLASVWALESLKHGRTLLEVLSFLDPDRIQEGILTSHPEVSAVEAFPKTKIAYQSARTELLQCSLITRNAEKIQVHRLIQDAARTKMGKDRIRAIFSATVALVSSIWPYQEFDWRHGVKRWRMCEQLFPHVLSLQQHHSRLQMSFESFEEGFQFAKLLTDAGWFYHECGRSSDAAPMFASAQSMAEKLKSSLSSGRDLEVGHHETTQSLDALLAEIHHNFGCIGTETNDPIGTLEHFKTFNELMMREIGDGAQGKDKRLAISWNELGNAYMLNGMWEKGEECFKRSMSTMKRVDGFKNIDMSFALVNLGLAYWLTDRLELAAETLLEGLGHRESLYGLDDNESFITGRFLHALGNVKTSQGLRSDSRAYHNRALAQFLSTVGKNHHRTGDLHVKVAEHHYHLQQNDEALRHIDLALDIFAPRPLLKPEKARALFKKSKVLETLGSRDQHTVQWQESVHLYNEVCRGNNRDAKDLTEDDFDKIVAFWSR